MKYLVLISTILWSANFTDLETGVQEKTQGFTKNERLEIVFNTSMDFDELVAIRDRVKGKGITLEYKHLLFNTEGKLKEIRFSVDCGDGFSGESGKRLSHRDNRYGFYRDYRSSVESPFGVGRID